MRNAWRPPGVEEMDSELWQSSPGGGFSASGARVTKETALNFTSYFSGVLQISQTIGSTPSYLYKRIGEGKEIFWSNPLNRVLSMQANPYTDSYHWKEMMQNHAIQWGNGYSLIERDEDETIQNLWQLFADRMKIRVNARNQPEYVYQHPTRGEKVYQWNEIFHLAGFGYDGLQGYSLLSLHRNAIGLGLSQEEFVSRFLANGAHIKGFFKKNGELSEAAMTRLKADIQKNFGGVINTGLSPVLEDGLEYEPLNMPLKDAEFLASRVFQIQEIARILNIQTPKLKDYSKLTYNNAEQLNIEFRTDTIRPWAERWEAAINMQLLNPEQQRKSFAEFDLNAIARGDIKTESEAARTGRHGGWLSADDIRNKIGMNPIENEDVGKRYWQPVNMRDAALPENTADTGDSQEDTDESEKDDFQKTTGSPISSNGEGK